MRTALLGKMVKLKYDGRMYLHIVIHFYAIAIKIFIQPTYNVAHLLINPFILFLIISAISVASSLFNAFSIATRRATSIADRKNPPQSISGINLLGPLLKLVYDSSVAIS